MIVVMAVDPLIKAITPPTSYYVVLRPFSGDNETRYVRGEVVNTDGWTHRDQLVDLRYIAALPHGARVPDTGIDGKRMFDYEELEIVPEKKRPGRKTAQ